jgi:hypothetical protein
MPERRFDLSYAGALAPGADPRLVRERLTALFKLTEEGAAHLFSGRPVIVRRAADEATRARLEQLFASAGALLRVAPVDNATPDLPPAASGGASGSVARTSDKPTSRPSDHPPLAIIPSDGDLEPRRRVDLDAFDTSRLSLVAGQDWTLADCEPPPTPIPLPDISYLSLVKNEPTPEPRDPDDETQPP